MHKLISFLAIFSIANVANAEQINFTGHFSSGSGGIQVNDVFSGQFSLNLASPDSSQVYYPDSNPLSAPNGKIFSYQNNASGSAVFSGQQINVVNNVTLDFNANELITQEMIDSIGVKIPIKAGTYENVNLAGTIYDIEYVLTDIIDPITGKPVSVSIPRTVGSIGFSLNAFFDANTYSIDSLSNPSYQTLFDSASLRFLAFSVIKNKYNTGSFPTDIFRGIGVVDSFQVAAVPVPAAFWLFGSAISAFAFRLRNKA